MTGALVQLVLKVIAGAGGHKRNIVHCKTTELIPWS
jgi:hypothetical protein